MRWLAVRLDLISISLITTVALLIVFMHGHISPAYAGLAISYAVQVRRSHTLYMRTVTVPWLIYIANIAQLLFTARFLSLPTSS